MLEIEGYIQYLIYPTLYIKEDLDVSEVTFGTDFNATRKSTNKISYLLLIAVERRIT